MRGRIARIQRQRLLKIAGCLPENIFRPRRVHQVPATPVHDIGVDLEPLILVGEEHLRFFRQHYAQIRYRKFGNLALHFQEVFDLLIEAARYYVHAALGIDQLGHNPQIVADNSNASFEVIGDSQALPDIAGSGVDRERP